MLLAIGASSAQENRPAVELYNPKPVFPLEAEGSGLDPEVSVRVRVDARGRVSEVEVEKIEPSSALDAVFAEQMKETIGRWRYAPRYEGGKPVESELRWTTPFSGHAAARDRLRGWSGGSSILGRSRAVSILELPLEQRKRILEEQVRIGLSTLASGPSARADSARFAVYTDAGQATADTIAGNLESIFNLLNATFASVIPPQDEQLKMQVFVFSGPQKLQTLAGSGPLAESSPPGFYSHTGLIGMHLELASSEQALGLLLHEATHAYVDRHLVRPGVRLPRWLNEGLAEYFAKSEVKDGRLQPGAARKAPKHSVNMVQGSVVVNKSESSARLTIQEIRSAARRGEVLTLAEMLDADPGEFFGESRRFYYSAAWILVHFLRHGEAEWQEDFTEMLFYVAEGYRVSEAVETVYGVEVAELEPAFLDYLANF